MTAQQDTALHTSHSVPRGKTADLLFRYAGLIPVFAMGAVMIAWGWRRWADLLVDYGNQLYIPWRITEGDVLYRDLFYVFGPLSSYLHAGLFSILGPGAHYLSLFNIVLTVLLTILIYSMALRLSDRWTATMASLVFLLVHALGQHKFLGNYNFIQPYSYDLTHGILLSFIALHQVLKYLERPTSNRVLVIGLLLGLVFVTKIEVMLAAGLAVPTGLVLAVSAHRLPPRIIARHVLISLMGAVTPLLAFLIFFSLHMPPAEALSCLFLPWKLAMAPEVHDFFYFKKMKGIAFLGHNLYQIFLYTGVLIIILAGLLACNRLLNKRSANSWKPALVLSAILAACVLAGFPQIPWRYFLKPLPLLVLALGVFLIFRLQKNFSPNRRFVRDAGLLVLAIFGLALMLKVFFRVVIMHYGFALSVPAAVVTVIALTYTLPQALGKRWGPQFTYRFAVSALLIFYAGAMSFDSYLFFSKKQLAVGRGPDLIYDYHPMSRMEGGKPYMKGLLTKFALEYIEQEIPPDATLTVMPDAVVFNYLSRHRDPAKGFLLNPVTWVLFERDDYLLRLLRHEPPDYIALVDRSYFEFDLPLFGKDYGVFINQWIQNHYQLIKQIGSEPFTVSGFGIQIYKRKGGYESN